MKTTVSNPEPVVEHDFSNGIRGSQQQKYALNLAGEFYVAAELNRRGIFASVTYGAAKNADVLAFNQQSRKTAVIEVKTTASANKKWITGQHSIDKSSINSQLFWVLVLVPGIEDADASPRFFVFTSKELVGKVSESHAAYRAKYQEKHGTQFQDSGGIYSLSITEAEAMQAEGQWSKLYDWLAHEQGPAGENEPPVEMADAIIARMQTG